MTARRDDQLATTTIMDGTRVRPRCVVYPRVSTDAQAAEDKLSVPEQRDKCVAFADEQGWELVEVLTETFTGMDLFARPQMTRLRAMVQAGLVDVVLAWHPDRISRDPDHRAFLRVEFAQVGARIVTLYDHRDDGTVMGRAMDYIGGVGSYQEWEQFRRRTVAAKERKVRGDAANGIPPRLLGAQRVDFGLRWPDGPGDRYESGPRAGKLKKERFEPDPATAPIVSWMFQEFDRGASLRRLQKLLVERGVAPPLHARTGRAVWSLKVIRGVLMNEHYVGKGYQRTTRTEKVAGRRVVSARPREEWVAMPTGTYPALIDPALFNRVQARLKANRRESQRADRNPEVGLLRRGIGVCGYCGKALSIGHNEGTAIYRCQAVNRDRYGCPEFAMRVHKLDAEIWAFVELLLQRPEVLEAALAGLKEEDPAAPHLPAVEARLASLERRRATTRRRLAETEDDLLAAEYETELKAILAELREAEAQHALLLARRAAWQTAEAERQAVLDYAADVRSRLGAMTFDDKRQALIRLGARVDLCRADDSWRWRLSTRWQRSGAAGWHGVIATADGVRVAWAGDAAELVDTRRLERVDATLITDTGDPLEVEVALYEPFTGDVLAEAFNLLPPSIIK